LIISLSLLLQFFIFIFYAITLIIFFHYCLKRQLSALASQVFWIKILLPRCRLLKLAAVSFFGAAFRQLLLRRLPLLRLAAATPRHWPPQLPASASFRQFSLAEGFQIGWLLLPHLRRWPLPAFAYASPFRHCRWFSSLLTAAITIFARLSMVEGCRHYCFVSSSLLASLRWDITPLARLAVYWLIRLPAIAFLRHFLPELVFASHTVLFRLASSSQLHAACHIVSLPLRFQLYAIAGWSFSLHCRLAARALFFCYHYCFSPPFAAAFAAFSAAIFRWLSILILPGCFSAFIFARYFHLFDFHIFIAFHASSVSPLLLFSFHFHILYAHYAFHWYFRHYCHCLIIFMPFSIFFFFISLHITLLYYHFHFSLSSSVFVASFFALRHVSSLDILLFFAIVIIVSAILFSLRYFS